MELQGDWKELRVSGDTTLGAEIEIAAKSLNGEHLMAAVERFESCLEAAG